MKRLRAPLHRDLVRPYLRDIRVRQRIEAGVQRLKVISQIVALREKLGLTQGDLARRVCVSQPYIAKIENDEASNLSLETLVKIAEALNGKVQIRIRARTKAA